MDKIKDILTTIFLSLLFLLSPLVVRFLGGFVPVNIKVCSFCISFILLLSNFVVKKQIYLAYTVLLYLIICLVIIAPVIHLNFYGCLMYFLSFFHVIGIYALINAIKNDRGNFDEDFITPKLFILHLIIVIAAMLISTHVCTPECAKYF